MKTLLLAFLLVATAGVHAWRRPGWLRSSRTLQAPRREASPTIDSATAANVARSSVDATRAGETASGFRTPWEAYAATNLPAFVHLLRRGGCPEDTVRLFALAAVGRPLLDQLEAPLREEVRNSPWWQAAELRAHRALSASTQRARQQLDEALIALVGDSAEPLRQQFLGNSVDDWSWLSTEQRLGLRALQARQSAEIAAIEERGIPGGVGPQLTPALRDELRLARQRHREELRGLLGSETYAAYEVRESAEAQYVRNNLPEARSEVEFRLLVQAAIETGVEPADAQAERLAEHLPAQTWPDPPPRPRESILQRFRELASPERATELDRDLAAEKERAEDALRVQREESSWEHLQFVAQAGGATLSRDEAQRLSETFERRSAELEKEWGPLPPDPTPAERAVLEERLVRELETLAAPILGDRTAAFARGLRQELQRPR